MAEKRQATQADTEPVSPADLSKPSLKAVFGRARREFQRDHLTDLAAALTYYGVLSIVPALIVLLSIFGLIGSDTTSQVTSQVEGLAPGSSAQFVKTLISQAQSNKTGAGVGAILGILIALWSASGYVAAFMRASNVIYDVPEGRPIWKTLPTRVGVTILAVLVFAVSAVLVVVSGPVAEQIGNVVGAGDTTVLLWNILKWPVLVVLISLLLAVLFWASPNAQQGGIKWVSPGGLIAVLIWLVILGPLRGVRRELLLIQQDVRVAGRHRHLPGLAVAQQHRHPARGRGQRRAGPRQGHRGRAARGRRTLRRTEGHAQVQRRAEGGSPARSADPRGEPAQAGPAAADAPATAEAGRDAEVPRTASTRTPPARLRPSTRPVTSSGVHGARAHRQATQPKTVPAGMVAKS